MIKHPRLYVLLNHKTCKSTTAISMTRKLLVYGINLLITQDFHGTNRGIIEPPKWSRHSHATNKDIRSCWSRAGRHVFVIKRSLYNQWLFQIQLYQMTNIGIVSIIIPSLFTSLPILHHFVHSFHNCLHSYLLQYDQATNWNVQPHALSTSHHQT